MTSVFHASCVSDRRRLRQCTHWAVRIALLTVGQQLHAESRCKLDEISVLPVSMHGMHAFVPATINGHGVTMIVDTGMSPSMLTHPALEELGLEQQASKTTWVKGITGAVPVESAVIGLFELGSLSFHDITFLVGGSGANSGASGLIGRDVLGPADVEYDFANGIIRFLKLQDCEGRSPVYWKSGAPVNALQMVGGALGSKSGVDRQILTSASLNGIPVHLMVDSGAGNSIVSSRAARDAGVRPETPGVVPAPMTLGLGGRPVKTWIGTFSSLRIGNEEVRNTRLRFCDLGSPRVDILLGADFFLSHRIIVADSQQTIYATYNGGAVFELSTNATRESVTTDLVKPKVRAVGGAMPRFADRNSPTDAASYSRRGLAFASRRDFDHAIVDLTRACKLDRGQASYFLERAQVYRVAGHLSLAQVDLNMALNLKPDYAEALVERAGARLDSGDRRGAKSDLDAAASYTGATANLRFDIATLYVRMKLPAQALGQIDLWVSTHLWDPKMPAAQNIRCLTKGLLNVDLDNAITACNVAVAAQPQSAGGLSNRGLVRLRAGQYEAALADFDAALALKPDLAVTLYRRGIAKLRLGRKTEGSSDMGAARALDRNIDTEEHAFEIGP